MRKIYVGNLPFTSTEEEVRGLFAEFGEVASCALPTDRDTGRPRGFAFIEMADEDAEKAIATLNGRDFGGRALRVDESRPPSQSRDGPGRFR